MLMEQNAQNYLSPHIEINDVEVEYGFVNSIEDPIVSPEQQW